MTSQVSGPPGSRRPALHSALEHSRSHACCEVGLLLLCLISPLSSLPAPEAKLSGSPWAPPHPCSQSCHVHEGKQGPRRVVLRQDVPAQPEAVLAVVLALQGSRGGPALPCVQLWGPERASS